jgi:hypothetical protein
VPPTIAPNGTLTFKPAPNAYGVAQLSAVLRDNGGIDNGGRDTSLPQAFTITVETINDVPVAYAQSVTVDEGASIAITLGASDIDGDSLTYTIGACAHGVLSGTPPALAYTPNPNYFGSDTFTFSVNDGEEDSPAATVSITINSVNDKPTAAITLTSLSLLEVNGTNYLLVAPDNIGALLIFDASNSTDPDGDSLEFFWFEAGAEEPFASGVRVTNVIDIGAHSIVLRAADGTDVGATSILVDIIPPAQAVEALLLMIDDAAMDRHNKRPFIASLKAAGASFEQGRMTAATNQLRAFQNKVRAQIAKADPALAAELIQATEDVLRTLAAQ